MVDGECKRLRVKALIVLVMGQACLSPTDNPPFFGGGDGLGEVRFNSTRLNLCDMLI
jgi:hypothetical protein